MPSTTSRRHGHASSVPAAPTLTATSQLGRAGDEHGVTLAAEARVEGVEHLGAAVLGQFVEAVEDGKHPASAVHPSLQDEPGFSRPRVLDDDERTLLTALSVFHGRPDIAHSTALAGRSPFYVVGREHFATKRAPR